MTSKLPFLLSLLEHGVDLIEALLAKEPSKPELRAELTDRLQRLVDRMARLPERFAEYDAALAGRNLPPP